MIIKLDKIWVFSYKTIAMVFFAMVIFYHDIFSLPCVPMKIELWILPVGTGFFWHCQWRLGFNVANENWVLMYLGFG